MDNSEIKVNVSGKAIYKAVKNLLENDGEFRTQVMNQVAKELADTSKIEEMISRHVSNLIAVNPHIKQQIKDEVMSIAHSEIPNVIKSKIDTVMKKSLTDMLSKLMGGK
jgi:predicted XRE-type DNA-binding protein